MAGDAPVGSDTMDDTQIVDHVSNGAQTVTEFADQSGKSHGHAARLLREASERGPLARERDGRSFVYSVPTDAANETNQTEIPDDTTQTDESGTDTDTDTGGVEDPDVMPVTRGYDFDDLVPDPAETPEYIAHNGERQELNALIETREARNQPVRALIGGPTGCGKTTLAESIAAEHGWPLFTIQGKYTMREKDLLGSPLIIGGETRWADGVLTKALLASAERPVVLLVDEANRARPQAKSVLFSALDHRASVTLDGGRGGETVQGNPLNLIVIATINEGRGYMVEQMDTAEKRRFGAKWNVDYLGRSHPEREVTLVAERTGVSHRFGELLVRAANDIRDTAADATSNVPTGVPTSALLTWASTVQAYADHRIDNPVIRAADAQIVRAFYDDAADEVAGIIQSHLDGAPGDMDEFADWVDDEVNPAAIKCGSDTCDFSVSAAEADEQGITDWFECPDCGHHLTFSEVR